MGATRPNTRNPVVRVVCQTMSVLIGVPGVFVGVGVFETFGKAPMGATVLMALGCLVVMAASLTLWIAGEEVERLTNNLRAMEPRASAPAPAPAHTVTTPFLTPGVNSNEELRRYVEREKARQERRSEARRRRRERKKKDSMVDAIQKHGTEKLGWKIGGPPKPKAPKAAPDKQAGPSELERDVAILDQTQRELSLDALTKAHPKDVTWFQYARRHGDMPAFVTPAENMKSALGLDAEPKNTTLKDALVNGGVVALSSGTLVIPADMMPHRLAAPVSNPMMVPVEAVIPSPTNGGATLKLAPTNPGDPIRPEDPFPTKREQAADLVDGAESPAPTNPRKFVPACCECGGPYSARDYDVGVLLCQKCREECAAARAKGRDWDTSGNP